MPIEFDEDYHAYRLDFTTRRSDDHHQVDEYVFEINNPTSETKEVPVVFKQLGSFKWITGTVLTLNEESDGRPTGIPVQVSKNWHNDLQVKHAGYWLRGSSVISVAAQSKRKLVLRVIHGYWDQAATASHSQLSLVGWGKYAWQWDESALGAWGESMTFDPGQTVAGAFMADIRPTFTTPTDGSSDHAWTENVGGGDFLKYFDHNGKYRWSKKLKTAYRWTGPNMTEVLYSGVTDDDSIKFVYTTQLVRGNDYHRRFNHFRYEFLKDIKPKRLVFYQMAADYYMTSDFEHAYYGNTTDVQKLIPTHGGNKYTVKFPFQNKWLSIEDDQTGQDTVHANRGIIMRNSTLNGADYQFYSHIYGRDWGRNTSLFDISGPTVDQSYSAGDIIEGEVTFIMPAKSKNDYWGQDKDFVKRLTSINSTWQLTKQEYVYNTFIAKILGGKILKHYPIEVKKTGRRFDIQLMIPRSKGIGYIPVIVKNVNKDKAIFAHIYQNGNWQPASSSLENYNKHGYYQAYLNQNGTLDYVFNIKRPDDHPFNKALKIRITNKKLSF